MNRNGKAVARLRSLGATFSPARREWHRFLRSLPLDETSLPVTLEAPSERDFIICGCPRTGTSLAAAALFQPPAVVTVMEPWDGMRMLPAELFASLRCEVETTGSLSRGRLDIDALTARGAVAWIREGTQRPTVEVDPGWRLGVKWPGFWRYLELLPTTKFVVCLRDPREVIASFKTTRGPASIGLQRDIKFNRRLNGELRAATSDDALRRVLLFDYVHRRVVPHLGRDNVFALRYERWRSEPRAVMADLSTFLDIDLPQAGPTITPTSGASVLDDRDLELIRRHCETASALGYELP